MNLKDQLYRIIREQSETTVDNLIVQMYGGSLISSGQMEELQRALDQLATEGKIERTFWSIKPLG
ncbi:hypothetical protein [Heliophilum fasciatum]|uniref:Uncharacterized protein n=1 Tax=Heliophilum fasciatum TaxID=35700 RepID=A0A4R2RGA1_9FIRM|nr:hypothetical protein [Heliophilum fasciatum]MCW2278608.1 hypothetical protein [Heliophilum fasciatum]TCP62690.1 hypothetical protein EDD73_11938 [Heliophilum fasciatum]